MREIGKKSDLSYVDDFELPDNPTTLLPLRMIHNYSCLPIGLDEDGRIELVAVRPPSTRMSRWVFAVSGRTPVWSLSSPGENFPGDYRELRDRSR